MDEMLIDYSEKIVAIAGHKMEFTKIEYQIIEFLSMHPGQVFDKERIYEQVCGYDAEGDSRTITELVRRIRKKIADCSEKEYIETVWGIGYRWKNKKLVTEKNNSVLFCDQLDGSISVICIYSSFCKKYAE